jgi:FkbM family methyltransferase
MVPLMEFAGLKLQKCRHGWMLCAGPLIGKCLELYGEYSEGEVATMGRYVRAGDTVIDVGANIGSLTLPLAGLVGAQGRVCAFESQAYNFNLLCAHLALNGIEHVRPLNAFVSDVTDPKTWGEVWGSYVSDKWPTPVMKLDDLGLDSCALIKIDVDGGELGVLKSAARLIDKVRPVLYFENDVPAVSRELLQHVFDLNYDLYWDAQPIFKEENFLGNTHYPWSTRYNSLMVLALPGEKGLTPPEGVRVVDSPEEWWN